MTASSGFDYLVWAMIPCHACSLFVVWSMSIVDAVSFVILLVCRVLGGATNFLLVGY